MNRNTHSRLVAPAAALCERKQQDYNPPGMPELESYFPFGAVSYAQMIHIKSQRLVALAMQSGMPANESARDTLYDMINYAVFYLSFLEQNNAK